MNKEQIIKEQKEKVGELLEVFNNSESTALEVKRNLEMFKNAIQLEFYKLLSKKLKTLKINKIEVKDGDENKINYEKFHNEMLEILNGISISLAEACLDDVLKGIEAGTTVKQNEIKFKDLKIIVKDDEQIQKDINK